MITFDELSASAGGSSTDFSSLLSLATSLWEWILSIMTSLVNFIFANPAILVFFLLALVSFGVGMFFRVWRKAKG